MSFFGLFGQKVNLEDLKAKLAKVKVGDYILNPRKDNAGSLAELEANLGKQISKIEKKALK